jgi:diguanylate cyclase (GGDEF)-like protein/PAS domain S-box-containing protein
MSAGSPAWTVAGGLLAAAAAVLLLRRSRAGGGAYRWLAAAAALWGAAFIAQIAAVGSVTPTEIELSLTDLLALVGLVPLVTGLFKLAPADGPPDDRGGVIDGCLLSLGVFGVAWIALLRHAYMASAVGVGSFAVDLIHPLADLVALGGTLVVTLRTGRTALLPYLALVSATVGDLVSVQARASGVRPGALPQLAWLLAICLLGLVGLWTARATDAPATGERAAVPGRVAPAHLSTAIGLTAATVAAIVTLIFAVVTWGNSGPVPLIAGSALMLALAGRAGSLLLQAAATSELAELSGSKFLQLAERTSDVVLLCDMAGLVTYASQAVARYGYESGQLAGQRLADLVHPDDRVSAVRAVAAVTASSSAPASSLACQVRAADGTWRDVQATISRYAGSGRRDAMLITARDISDQVALRRQVTHLTFHDGLTGLPNRAYLEERAKDLLARQSADGGADQPERSGAIFVDLDGFTAINDSVGHGAGDLLLAQVGRRLRGLVPAHDTVARWGGDEFAILIEHSASPQEIVDMAERLVRDIAAVPFQVADRDVTMTAALGVAFADPDAGEHLLRNADLAMAIAKEAGGDQVEVFAAHMHADVIRRLELATDLRQAIACDGLTIEYQPLVELSTSRVAGVEALVRWSRAGELVPTVELLSIAEESGLIVALGDWVLREAARQVTRWRTAGWPIGLSVNFSLRQVSAPRFAEAVLTALDDSGLPRSALTIEVTERVLIEVAEPIIDELARLRQLGVRLAIDDFGTGYASLAYLRELPVDIIKIDPSFVAGLGTDGTLAMLTRTIVQVGHDLGIEIVAEGIERPEQLELLRAMGCGLGQGYLVARPMTAPGIESFATPESFGRAGSFGTPESFGTAGSFGDAPEPDDRGHAQPDGDDAVAGNGDAGRSGSASDAAAAAPAG